MTHRRWVAVEGGGAGARRFQADTVDPVRDGVRDGVGDVLRVDVGRNTVIVLPDGLDMSTIETLIAEISVALDSELELETIYLDLHNVASVDDRFLRAVRVWAQALDGEAIDLRLRRPRPTVRRAITDADLEPLIDGY